MSASWQDIVARKRALRDALIEKHVTSTANQSRLPLSKADIIPYHSEKVRNITQIEELGDLKDKLAVGELTAEEVVSAYIERVMEVHQITNCLTEILFDSAIEEARVLDAYYQANKKPVGPLHGIPITLKDQFDVAGVDTTIGYVGRSFAPATEDAVLVQILKSLGAIIVAKTNLPQTIMWNETENPLWGRTDNPRNVGFTTGGSTGGEGALLATQGTMIGWGTDIGGSVRIPAAINGVYALRPSSGRLPYLGVPVSTEGQEHVHSVIGPMTRTLSALTIITRCVIDASPWRLDPRCHPIPWREELYQSVQTRPLTIGVMFDDGVVRTHPPIRRAMEEMASKLVAAGHEVVEWEAEGLHEELVSILDAYYASDGCEDIRLALADAGEPQIPRVKQLLDCGPAISVFEYWALNRRKLAAQVAYQQKWNASKGLLSGREVDVLLTPIAPHTAVPHGMSRWTGYTKVWNVLDYSAVAFPVSEVLERDVKIEGYVPRNDQDAWNWPIYDNVKMRGMPVGLQIVGRRLEEEKVLGAAKVFGELLSR